jgi:hypothetical protein
MKYAFNPEDYGYEHVSKFPELIKFMDGMVDSTYIKVIAVCSEHDDELDLSRSKYWYSRCYNIADTDRWEISSNSFNIKKSCVEYQHKSEYSSLITSDFFAEELLTHILSGCMNSSFNDYGKTRLERNINNNRLDGNTYD